MRIVKYTDKYFYTCGITPHKHKQIVYMPIRSYFKTMSRYYITHMTWWSIEHEERDWDSIKKERDWDRLRSHNLGTLFHWQLALFRACAFRQMRSRDACSYLRTGALYILSFIIFFLVVYVRNFVPCTARCLSSRCRPACILSHSLSIFFLLFFLKNLYFSLVLSLKKNSSWWICTYAN
jgi:hypothetical protein